MTRLLIAAWDITYVALYGQSGNNKISGTVKDASDAVVPNARIQIVNVDTGVRLQTTSNESGIYRVSSLVPGSYRAEVDATGFDHLARGAIVVQVSQTLALDLVVAVGQQSTAVTVEEAAPLTESQSSNIAQAVNRQMLAG